MLFAADPVSKAMLLAAGLVLENYVVCNRSFSAKLYCFLQVLFNNPLLFFAGFVKENYVVCCSLS